MNTDLRGENHQGGTPSSNLNFMIRVYPRKSVFDVFARPFPIRVLSANKNLAQGYSLK